ncbi:Type I Iterative PKS [Arachnomyces sp. PD_36]|nr:Type I Iterative PKS [Arachnomyces sp. PD_36]
MLPQTNGAIKSDPSCNGNTSDHSLDENDDNSIAIVGTAMRLPGGIRSTDEFWDMLINKRDGRVEVPSTRYNVQAFLDSVRTKHGYFLQEDPALFDAAFFSILPAQAEQLDPQQRLLLEVIWECLENAGETDWQGARVGCYVGVFGEDWLEIESKDSQRVDRYRALGTGAFALANHVSYQNDFRGPSMTIQTGCSSSMVALHEACQAVRSDQCSSAIVAGVNLIWTPTMTTTMYDNMVLSPSGISRTFDAKADGYGRGEAVNAIYIKSLRDALRDNDPIRAVIRSTATNCDGKTPNITNPCVDSQEALIRSAYHHARIPDDEIYHTALFECHGTGTIVGDTVESSAVAKVFGDRGIILGAVKPNVGHSEGGSGLTSLIKAAMCLERKIIPPVAHFESPNPSIPFQEANLQVPSEPMPWPADRRERVSINSFGIGGSNAHVILDSASAYYQARDMPPDASELLLISAQSADSLQKRIRELTQYANNHFDRLHDLAYTLGVRRKHLQHRAFTVIQPNTPLDESSFEIFRSKPSDSMSFVFTGQGAQWPGMGYALMKDFACFREIVEEMDSALRALKDPPQWSLKEKLGGSRSTSKVNEAEFSQPLCTAVQIGLVRILDQWGIKPSSVVGHSSGEIAAAYAAGAITAPCAIILAYYRGKVAKSQEGFGAMAAVGLGPEEVTPFLRQGITIACYNSPRSVTISGDEDGINCVLERINIENPGTLCRRLRVKIAYHSHHMQDIGPIYESCIAQHLEPTTEMLPFFSSVTDEMITEPCRLDATYWRQNLESPVLFSNAVKHVLRSGEARIFLEIGPHSALAGPLRQVFQSINAKSHPVYIPTLARHDDDCRSRLLSTAGKAFAVGATVKLSDVIGGGNTLTDLPLYPWQHNIRYWKESRLSRDWRLRSIPHHELLGARIVESTDREPSWRNVLRLENVPWLYDHVIRGDITFPGAGYIAMAGEAVSQLHPDSDSNGYSIRNVIFKVPLTLQEDKITEIITNLRPFELADNVHSGWYTFTITAHDGKAWTQHCQGQARVGYEHPPEKKVIQPFVRSVKSEKLFRALRWVGLDFGPHFRGLKDITADPMERRAAATLIDTHKSENCKYAVHPTAIDQCLQLVGVAVCSGTTRHIAKMYVPATIDSIFVANGGPEMAAESKAYQGLRDGHRGDAVAMFSDRTVLTLKGCYMFALDEPTDPQRSVRLVTRAEWKPDIDLMPSDEWLPAPDDSQDYTDKMKIAGKLCLLYILETADRIRDVDSESPDLMKWKRWIMGQALKISQGIHPIYPDSSQWAQSSSAGRERLREQASAQLDSSRDSSPPLCMQQVFEHCLDFMNGKISPLEALMRDQLLERYYVEHQKRVDWARFLDLQCHSNPTLRILEIGAGTGASTREVLKHLKSPEGVRMYSKYYFTDISPPILSAAQENLGHAEFVEYCLLDISQNPLEQGFEAHSYDLIIASNVLHATPSLQATLKHVYTLLARNGRLLVHELHPELPITDYIMGVLPGWWVGQNDERADKPYVSPERWDRELRAAGFTGAQVTSYDAQPPYQTTFSLISSLAEEAPIKKGVTCLTSTLAAEEWVGAVEQRFTNESYTLRRATLDQPPPKDQCIISLLDLHGPHLDHLSESAYLNLRSYFEQAHESRFLWVTQATQLICNDPRFGYIHGLARTLRHELGLDISILEIDSWDSAAVEALIKVYEHIQRTREISHVVPEYEYALHNGVVHVGRFHWTTLSSELSTLVPKGTSRKLDIASYGLLDTLRWAPIDDYLLESGQVEVDIQYVGLNFRDMMVAMGLVGSKDELGLEGSGVIRRVGPGVNGLQCGDRVALMHCGLLATRIVAAQQSCLKLPETLSLEDSASMLSVYVTAIYSIVHAGMLKEGQSILIHSACGGVGLASIRVCQIIGAEIYVTVGTDEKVQYLMETFGLPENRIFNSRDTSFHPALMRETNGRGVDVVLNSLSGKLLHASWECVAPFGRMIELGKRDFLTHGKLSMSPFISNRAFFGVDLLQITQESPLILESVMTTLMGWYHQGKIKPIRPVKFFEATHIVEAFRFMQSGTHMGKILIRMPSDLESLPIPSTSSELTFRSQASYLLVGGLGGIGRSISQWMVEQGARELVYLSRSAGHTSDDQAFIRELEVQGCSVICVHGDVANEDDVNRAVSKCTLPLAGVLQMAVNLQDRTFLKMTHEQWTSGLACKVDGSWNLHNAVQSQSLDFFVVFSSIVGTCGHISQANYAAASTFLGSFTKYRRQLGLPSSILTLGVVEEVGLVSRQPKILQNAQLGSLHLLQECDVIEGLKLAIHDSQPVSGRCTSRDESMLAIGMGHRKPLSDAAVSSMWTRDARFTLYSNLEPTKVDTGTGAEDSELRELLSRAERNPSILEDRETEAALMNILGRIISQRLNPDHESMDVQTSSIVIDSLMSIEVRNWAHRLLGVDLSLAEIAKAGTIGGLVSLAVEQFKSKYKQQL